jgi:hypothetical protein
MSRLDKLKEQHPELNITVIDLIRMIDPTDTYKYCDFLIKRLKLWYSTTDIQYGLGVDLFGEDNVKTLNEFEKHCNAKRIEKNDISSHEDFKSLEVEVKKAEEIVRLKELEKQTKKLFDNNEWLVLIPLSYEAAKLYGTNTKWCVTQERYWDDYIDNYKIIYVINRSTNDKYAISRDKTDDKDLKAWLADDTETSPLLLSLPQEIWSVVIPELQKEESIKDLNGCKSSNIVIDNDTVSLLSAMRRVVNTYGYGSNTHSYGNNDTYTDYLKQYMTIDGIDGDDLP